jgi:hypothetical protein
MPYAAAAPRTTATAAAITVRTRKSFRAPKKRRSTTKPAMAPRIQGVFLPQRNGSLPSSNDAKLG